MAPRLASSSSPYLLQHAGDRIDWHPWGEEAFAAARERDVPVLLSVGYAACHWCHVMARESFADAGVADVVNAGFVPVVVDRDERPDVDFAYMAAVTALTGQGGWPATVFLTPQGEPFHAGTYYPPQPHRETPSFRQVLGAVGAAWRERRHDVEGAAGRITAVLAARPVPVAGMAMADDLEAAVVGLAADEDPEHGGFGGAPKFPPPMLCEFLLRHAAAPTSSPASAATALGVAVRALGAVARSGMVDQVAGGSARYAVDAAWVVPHFEKMLSENALLARTWLHWWRLTGAPEGRRAALETCDWMVGALGTREGGFASSLDADADGAEGTTYTWTPAQLAEALDDDDAAWAAELLGVTARGTFAHGASTLHLVRDPWLSSEDAERWLRVRARLRATRGARPQPARDHSVVTAGNGLAVAALAEVGAQCGRPDLLQAAGRCAELLLRVHHDHAGRLLRVSRDGVAAGAPALLDDHGCLADGLLALHAATGETGWWHAAGEVLEAVLTRFVAGPPGRLGRQAGGPALYDTPHDAGDPRLARFGRPADPTDGATPSGASAAAGALLTWSALSGSGRHRAAAEAALAATGALARSAPRSAGWGLAVAQIAVATPAAGRRGR